MRATNAHSHGIIDKFFVEYIYANVFLLNGIPLWNIISFKYIVS